MRFTTIIEGMAAFTIKKLPLEIAVKLIDFFSVDAGPLYNKIKVDILGL